MYTTNLQNQALNRDWDIMYIWDAYKSVYGHRPHHVDFDAMTSVEVKEMRLDVEYMVDFEIRAEKRGQAKSKIKFENLVSLCLSSGAKTRKQAIKWLVDAEALTVYDKYISIICEKFGISLEEYYQELKTIFPKMRIY